MLEPILYPMIAAHVATAIASIILGIFAMRSHSSKKRHGQIGRAYGVCMGISMLLGVLILTVRFNFFLALVTVLSTQSLITGYRAAKRKAKHPVNWLDWTVTYSVGLFTLGYFAWTGMTVLGVIPQTMPTVFLWVGVGFCVMLGQGAVEEARFYRSNSNDRRAWLFFHMNRMLGSYVALMTAFSITAARYVLPPDLYWVFWTLPPVVGSIMIARFIKRYRARIAPKRAAAIAAD